MVGLCWRHMLHVVPNVAVMTSIGQSRLYIVVVDNSNSL